MIAILILSLILLFVLYAASILESISRWMDEANFKDESLDNFSDLDNSEYDWGHNIKNYIEDE